MKRVKCFILRHQHEGLLTGTIYTAAPTPEEIAPIAAGLLKRHGLHPKTQDPYWLRVQESVLVVPDNVASAFEHVPDAPPPAEDGVGEPGTANLGVSGPKLTGRGTVTNPGTRVESMSIGPDDVTSAPAEFFKKK